jgi:hypothetical protein
LLGGKHYDATDRIVNFKCSAGKRRRHIGTDSICAIRVPQDSPSPSVSFHKIAVRIDIERLGFTIIAHIGDQQSDLVGGNAERTFKSPNPFYFID